MPALAHCRSVLLLVHHPLFCLLCSGIQLEYLAEYELNLKTGQTWAQPEAPRTQSSDSDSVAHAGEEPHSWDLPHLGSTASSTSPCAGAPRYRSGATRRPPNQVIRPHCHNPARGSPVRLPGHMQHVG